MPSGPKKRKAAKRKNQKKKQDAASYPNPNSQGDGKEKRLDEVEEYEDEETFGTPRSRPETPMFASEPNSVYFSMGSMRNERREVMKELSEVISMGLDFEMDFKDEEPPVVAFAAETSIGSVQLDGPFAEREGKLETGAFDEETTHIVSSSDDKEVKVDLYIANCDKGEELRKDNESLKESILDSVTPFKVNESAKNDEDSKEMKSDECVVEEESSIERVEMLGIEEGHPPIEQSVPFDEEMTPKALIEVVDVSSSNEKEVKVVPWPDEEIPTGNGDADVNINILHYEKGGNDNGDESLEGEFSKDDDLLEDVKFDECVRGIENKSKMETEEGLRSVKQSVPWDEDTSPKFSNEAVDVSSSNEKEEKIVPWPDELLLTDNGDADVNDDVVNYEKGGDNDGDKSVERKFDEDNGVLKETKLDEFSHDIENKEKLETEEDLRSIEHSILLAEEMTRKSLNEAAEVSLSKEDELNVEISTHNGDTHVDGDDKENLQRRFQKDEDLQETNSVNFCEFHEQPVPVNENCKDKLDSLSETMPNSDVDFSNKKMDKSIEHCSVLVDDSFRTVEEASQGTKASHEISECMVGTSNASSHEEKPSPDAEKTEIVQRNEIGRGPMVAHRATLWNCCGFLEVLTSCSR